MKITNTRSVFVGIRLLIKEEKKNENELTDCESSDVGQAIPPYLSNN
jgi:hypothetical protein